MHASRSTRPHALRRSNDTGAPFEVLSFAEIELDLSRYQLRRDGFPVEVEPKTFDLLVYLARHAGRVVTKADIARDVWQQEYISEAVVNRVIGLIRKAIGDNARHPRHVFTVFRRGYRFASEVTVGHAAPAPITQESLRRSHIRDLAPKRARPLVGHAAERACVQERLGEVLAGETITVLVTGERGSGKTHFVEALARDAEGLGISVVHAGSRERPLPTPLAERLRTLRERGDGSPTLLVVEDADARTPDELALLAALSLGGHPLCLAVTFRDSLKNDALCDFATGARKRAATVRLNLAPLTVRDVRELAREAHRTDVDEDEAREIVRLTGGNAELVSLCMDGYVEQGRSLAPVPRAVIEAVSARIRALAPEVRSLVERAAVLGETMDPRVLAALAGSSAGVIEDLLEAAVDARFLIVRDGAVAHVHPIVREAVYTLLDATRRAELHLAAAHVIRSHTSAATEDPALLARHYGEAIAIGGAPHAAFFGERSADALARRNDHAGAVATLRRCLGWLEGEPLHHARRARLGVKLGAFEHAAGEYEAAESTLRRAHAIAWDLDDLDLRIETLLSLLSQETSAGPDEGTLEGGERALASLGEEPTTRRALLEAHLAAARHRADEHAEGPRLAMLRAESLARALGDAATLASVLARKVTFERRPSRLAARTALAEEAVAHAIRAQDARLLCSSRMALHDALLEGARVDEAREQAQLVTSLAERHGLGWPLRVRAVHAWMEGRFAETERSITESLGSTFREPANMMESYRRHQLIVLYVEQGRHKELMRVLDVKSVLDEGPSFVQRSRAARLAWEAARAQAHVELGDEATARAIVTRLGREAFPTLADDPSLFVVASHLADVLPRLGERALAEALYDMLAPYEDRLVVIGPSLACYGSLHMQLGLLARAFDAHDAACAHFERALAIHRALSASPLVARSLFELSRCHVRTPRPGGDAWLAEAKRLVETHGLVRLKKRMQAELARQSS